MKYLRLLLFPFSIFYYIITAIRNYFFERKWFPSYEIPVKSICVGNLSLGGTGKSPLVSYLIGKFKEELNLQILSRGYGRKTKGFINLTQNSTATEVGDEPLMYKLKYKEEVAVTVCEDRTSGIKQILKEKRPDLLILDDAFQHRKVQAGLSILLTEYSKPFFKDFLVPAGNLRESRKGIKRADLVLVTKCPENLSLESKMNFSAQIKCHPENIFYSQINYGEIKSFFNDTTFEAENILLVTGIANPTPLIQHLKQKYRVETIKFNDHHEFSLSDLDKIHKKFDIFANDNKSIVTTEKDFVRLLHPNLKESITEKPWFYQEITIKIDRESEFLNKIKEYVGTI